MARVIYEAGVARRALKELRAGGVSPRVAACFGLCYKPELGTAHAEWLVPLAAYEALTGRQRALCMLAGAARQRFALARRVSFSAARSSSAARRALSSASLR